jgi:hypothetical protein
MVYLIKLFQKREIEMKLLPCVFILIIFVVFSGCVPAPTGGTNDKAAASEVLIDYTSGLINYSTSTYGVVDINSTPFFYTPYFQGKTLNKVTLYFDVIIPVDTTFDITLKAFTTCYPPIMQPNLNLIGSVTKTVAQSDSSINNTEPVTFDFDNTPDNDVNGPLFFKIETNFYSRCVGYDLFFLGNIASDDDNPMVILNNSNLITDVNAKGIAVKIEGIRRPDTTPPVLPSDPDDQKLILNPMTNYDGQIVAYLVDYIQSADYATKKTDLQYNIGFSPNLSEVDTPSDINSLPSTQKMVWLNYGDNDEDNDGTDDRVYNAINSMGFRPIITLFNNQIMYVNVFVKDERGNISCYTPFQTIKFSGSLSFELYDNSGIYIPLPAKEIEILETSESSTVMSLPIKAATSSPGGTFNIFGLAKGTADIEIGPSTFNVNTSSYNLATLKKSVNGGPFSDITTQVLISGNNDITISEDAVGIASDLTVDYVIYLSKT